MTKLEQFYAVLIPTMADQGIANTAENRLFFLTQFRKDMAAHQLIDGVEKSRWLADLDFEIVRLKLFLGLNLN